MPFVSGWWKHSIMMYHRASLPNSAFGDITLLSLKSDSRRIYTTEMGKHCKLGLPSLHSRLLNFYQDTTAYKVRNFPNRKWVYILGDHLTPQITNIYQKMNNDSDHL